MKLGEAHTVQVETYADRRLSLDLALGGGIPRAVSSKFMARKAPVKRL